MTTQPVNRAVLITTIKTIRQDWQKEVEGESLIEVKVSLGVFLLDLTEAFSLTQAETKNVLGARLFKEVDAFVNGVNEWLLEENSVQ